jgi:hypothetical protein
MDGNVSEDPRVFMRLAFDQAMQSAAAGEVPIGAVLVQQGSVLAQSHNHRETCRTPQPMLNDRDSRGCQGARSMEIDRYDAVRHPRALRDVSWRILLARIP